MKKFLSIILSLVMVFSLSATAIAAEPVAVATSVEQYTVSSALSNPEVYNFLLDEGKLDELNQAQDEIRNNQYESSANYASKALGNSAVSASDVQSISSKYGLQLPSETANVIDNGTINVKRNSLGDIIDIWYLYYIVTDSSFSVKAAFIDTDNPLDVVSGTISRYYLNNTTWTYKDKSTFSKSAVRNGNVYTWYIAKWGVKEKFEYDITVTDNGLQHKFNNANEDNFTRYNFGAAPYNSFTANGGQRHHFIPATSLTSNGFSSSTAYCIRMMTADHKLTGSYGSSTYVSSMTTLLKNKQYEDALKKEVEDLQAKMDCEGIAGSLQQKYYDEVITCLYQYEILFGIN